MTQSPPNNPGTVSSAKGIYRSLPRSIWVLGLVSMLMDISSELVHSLLPVFMATVLGASMVIIGIIEGIAEATAAVTKVFSGAVSDYFRKRKFLVVLGYGLGAITKPIFPLASTIGWVFGARFLDRIGKGIRGAPRDALVADVTPPELRGAAYGLRQSLDSVGAFVGPLLAVAFMIWLANDIKAVLWVAVVPAFLAVLLLIVAVRETEVRRTCLGFAGSFDLCRCQASVPSLLAYRRARRGLYPRPVQRGIPDTPRTGRRTRCRLRARDHDCHECCLRRICISGGRRGGSAFGPNAFGVGLVVLIAADVVLALAASPGFAFLGAALWGLHMALTQGLFSKLVADTAPAELRGTAFGIFNLVSGGALLLASVIAGLLWSVFGASATFIAGASFAALAAMGLLLYRPKARATAHTLSI